MKFPTANQMLDTKSNKTKKKLNKLNENYFV